MTITIAVPVAAASGPANCPGIDLRDPLGSAKCPVDGVTRQLLPSRPATSAPATSSAPDPASAPAIKRSDGDPPAQPTHRPTHRAARRAAPADGAARGAAGHGGSAAEPAPPMPATVRLPQAEPPDPYPEVAGDPAYDGAPGRTAVRAASTTEDARILWIGVATALVAALCALHLSVAGRRLRRDADRSPG